MSTDRLRVDVPRDGAQVRRWRRLVRFVPVLSACVLTMAAGASSAATAATARHHREHGAVSAARVSREWYEITDQTVAAAAFPEPVTQSRTWSVSWLAAARAVARSRNASFEIAAFAQALHDTLAAQVHTQQSQLDADLATTLASVPDGSAKAHGVAAGREEAAQVLVERQGDGLDTASVDTPFTPPPPGPGVWQPTPPTYAHAVRAGEGKAKSFLLVTNDQFDPGPPPSLSSSIYLRDLAEVRAFGSVDSAVRSARQTDVARFWEPAINIQYVEVLRAVLADTSRSLAWQSRLVAAFNIVTTDAQIAIYNSKFKYVFWRPVTAIRTGSVATDPSWTPLFTTPRYPDWLSGHGGVTGAAQQVLTAFLGRRTTASISVTSPTDPGSTHAYTTWAQISREVIDARVWEGIHFRFSDVVGARVGGGGGAMGSASPARDRPLTVSTRPPGGSPGGLRLAQGGRRDPTKRSFSGVRRPRTMSTI